MLGTLTSWVFFLSGILPATEMTHVPHLPGTHALA
jgi:hypothetical protein